MVKLLTLFCLSFYSLVSVASYPSWYKEIGKVEGVNLPRLSPKRNLKDFFSHPSFKKNILSMDWNTFRLPVEWNEFADDKGKLIEVDYLYGLEQVQTLVRTLKQVSKHNGRRIVLMIDFHQFKFGAQCGGVGVPSGIVDGKKLSLKDPNCLFRAFKLFWENNNNVQDMWIEFSIQFLKSLEAVALENQSWLTLGIEPMNEPFFGTDGDFLPHDSDILDHFKILKFLSKDLLKDGIERDLYSFYRRFILRLESRVSKEFMENSLFILDPILLDHLGVFIGPVPVFLKGDYKVFKKLKRSPQGTSLTWLAAPHQYGGSYDPSFFDFFPPLVIPVLMKYPNVAFNGISVNYRINLQSKVFKAIGMETIIGEWGTYYSLTKPMGGAGGTQNYVSDTLKGVKKHLKGHLWWIYDFNNGAHDKSYYLLQGNGNGHEEQRFKCEIALSVFGKCP